VVNVILGKISKFDAARCQILRLKCKKKSISAGVPPQTPLGSLQRSPDPLAVLTGSASKGRERQKGEEEDGLEGKKEKEEGKEGKKKRGKSRGQAPNILA